MRTPCGRHGRLPAAGHVNDVRQEAAFVIMLIGVTIIYEIKLNRKLELYMSLGRATRPIKAHDVLDLSISRRYHLAEYSNAWFRTRLTYIHFRHSLHFF